MSRTHDEAHNQSLILGLTTTLVVLCYCLYLLRILSRKALRTPLWIDDWAMFFALVCLHGRPSWRSINTCQVICTGMSVTNFLGEYTTRRKGTETKDDDHRRLVWLRGAPLSSRSFAIPKLSDCTSPTSNPSPLTKQSRTYGSS